MAHGHVDSTRNGLQLGTQVKVTKCCTGLYYGVKRLGSSSLNTKLDFSHVRTEGNGTLETQGFKSMEIKIPHPPMRVSVVLLSLTQLFTNRKEVKGRQIAEAFCLCQEAEV